MVPSAKITFYFHYPQLDSLDLWNYLFPYRPRRTAEQPRDLSSSLPKQPAITCELVPGKGTGLVVGHFLAQHCLVSHRKSTNALSHTDGTIINVLLGVKSSSPPFFPWDWFRNQSRAARRSASPRPTFTGSLT